MPGAPFAPLEPEKGLNRSLMIGNLVGPERRYSIAGKILWAKILDGKGNWIERN